MRPDGFGRTADVAVDVFADDRVLDAMEAAGPLAVLAYLAVVTGSWGRGERLTLAQVARRSPAAYRLLDALPELLTALQGVELLDAEGRIPDATWESWYGPARDRYATRVAAGAKGGQTTAQRRTNGGTGSTTTSTTSTRPSVPPSHREVGMGGRDGIARARANGAPAGMVFDPDGDDGRGVWRDAK